MSRLEPGSCFCCAITAEAVGEPFWINWDHDDDCRKAIGSPMTIWIGYHSEQVTFTNEKPKTFSKTSGVVRSFCASCGTSIGYQDEGLPAEVYLSIGFMDAPEGFRPAAHGYWEQRLPYVEMNDGLPREERYTRPRQPGLGFPRDR